ncbi:Bacteriohemerythrin [Ralstonia edaphis]|uniref:bacteriohemerythrin n=1 Tax=Ralstonia edaphi TaxID=3058599 RepID=UPI0028F593B9|nr:bacteriohemerythrin [Ralstonia sp. LMG 6871]CAJ0715560.1 Bacteriohemerythrin [Ralstonia sp. LMG 6871]
MPVIEWSEALQLGDAATDANHAEFCALLNAVADASDAEFIPALDAFIEHTEHHFGEENAWMDESDFPPRHCHRGEHDNVLALCREVRKRAAAGEMELGRRLVAELPDWFAQHVDVMDRMMTTYLAQTGNPMRNIEHVD